MPGRNFNSTDYRYGAFGFEKDDEVKGSGNHISFSDYGYDPRTIRRWRTDPKSTLLPHVSPYAYALNNFINVIDPDGEFPILINGYVFGVDSERGSPTYWDTGVLLAIIKETGYFIGDFKFVDGDQGKLPFTRYKAGVVQAKLDAQDVWNTMKKSLNEKGEVTEQLQVITHSRGSVYGQAYMETIAKEIKVLAKKDGIGFAYDEGSIIEYSVNLAPHQSNSINYSDNGTKNVNISRQGDLLSGNDASGNVINVHTSNYKDGNSMSEQHRIRSFVEELSGVLNILENSAAGNSSTVMNQIKDFYHKEYDSNVSPNAKSKVTEGN